MEDENKSRPFYNEYEALNQDASDFSREIEQAVAPIIKKYADNGFSLRQMNDLCIGACYMRVSYLIVMRAMEKRKKERLAQLNNRNINIDQNKEKGK